MPSFPLPSIPYPPPGDGYWGPVTSTLDWCEENYYLTPYCAEVINTLTNGMFAYLGFCGIRNCIRNDHDRVFLVGWLAYLMIGLGSFCFHSTLTYSMQLVDEISMIYTTCVLVYAIFSHTRHPKTQLFIALAITTLALSITAYYFHLGDPVFHQVAFGALTITVVGRGIFLMELTLRPRWRKVIAAMDGRPERWTNGHGAVVRAKGEFEMQQEKDRKDLKMLKNMYVLMGYGVACALGGFAIWNLDNGVCGTLRGWRRGMGMPWGFLLEGHGWWHILTGIAAYYNLVWNIWMRYGLYGRQDEIEVIWPSLVFSMPEVVKKDRMTDKEKAKVKAKAKNKAQ